MREHSTQELLSLGQPLSSTQQAELRALSPHATVTSHHFRDASPDTSRDLRPMLEAYPFDVALTICLDTPPDLLFKFPAALIDRQAIQTYCDDVSITLTTPNPEYVIISLHGVAHTPPEAPLDHGGALFELAHIREHIIQGDYRALFMLHLHARIHRSQEVTTHAPLVPDDLDRHDSALETFLLLFAIDEDLLFASASLSSRREGSKRQTISDHATFLTTLSLQQKDDLLLSLMSASSDMVRNTLLAMYREHASSPGSHEHRLTQERLAHVMDTAHRIKRERRS